MAQSYPIGTYQTRTYYPIGTESVQVRTSTFTGWIVKYKGGMRRLAIRRFGPEMSRFGILRHLLEAARSSARPYLEILSIEKTFRTEIHHVSADIFADD